MPKPGGKQPDFLQAHVDATGHAMTMTRLAEAAGYKTFDGANLRYGILAAEIGRRMGIPHPDISLLVKFIRPEKLSNRHWILILQPPFAKALKKVGWVS
jgi:hypothetical protein